MLIYRVFFLLSLLLSLSVSTIAQSVKIVKVVDSTTGMAIKSASVKHANGDMTMTNADGLFTISEAQGDNVTLSCVGYIREEAVIKDSLSVIRMIPSVRLLPELTVNPWNITMKAILKEQARQMKKGKKLRGNYLYRQSTSVDGRMTSIIEAFFDGRNVGSIRDLMDQYENDIDNFDAGSFTTTFYNNSRDSRLKVTTCGLSADGLLYYNK